MAYDDRDQPRAARAASSPKLTGGPLIKTTMRAVFYFFPIASPGAPRMRALPLRHAQPAAPAATCGGRYDQNRAAPDRRPAPELGATA